MCTNHLKIFSLFYMPNHADSPSYAPTFFDIPFFIFVYWSNGIKDWGWNPQIFNAVHKLKLDIRKLNPHFIPDLS